MKLGCQSAPTNETHLAYLARYGVGNICGYPEIGDGRLTLIDATDGPGWREAICAFADEGCDARAQAVAKMGGYRPPTWPAVFETVETFLEGLTRREGSFGSLVETGLGAATRSS